MTSWEEQLERDQRRNRCLSMKEYHQIAMPHMVKVAYGSAQDNLARKEWCEFNLRELWFSYKLSRGSEDSNPGSTGMYYFTSAHDTMMFKLTWGGAKPHPKRLP